MIILLLTILLIPLSLFIGIAASAIGFTAWPLIVPILFILCGFDLYLAIFSSLLVDCGNALVMTLIAINQRQIDIRRGFVLTGFALIWIIAGILFGTTFIPDNEAFFRGSAGIVTIIIGTIFILKGIKKNRQKKNNTKPHQNTGNKFSNPSKHRQHFIYLGVAIMAFQVGLFGIGGGMGYAIFLMLFMSFPVLKATGTAMMMTFFSTLFAACGIFFQIPDGLLSQPTVQLLAPMMVGLSMIGTAIGAKIAYSLSEQKINFLIGSIVILAGLLATAQKYILQIIS